MQSQTTKMIIEPSVVKSPQERAIKRIASLSCVVLVGFLLATIFHYLQAGIRSKGYPASTFLYIPQLSFGDFFDVLRLAGGDVNPYENRDYNLGYGPITLLLYRLMSFTNRWISLVLSYSLFLGAISLWSRWLLQNVRGLKPFGFHVSLILTAFTYPVLIVLDRGNVELFSFSLLVGFMLLRDQKKHAASAVLLGLAATFKIYVILFGLLFLADRKYKLFSLTISSFLVISFIGYLVMGMIWDQSMIGVVAAHLEAMTAYVVTPEGLRLHQMQHNHSIWALLQTLNEIIRGWDPEAFLKPYWPISFGLVLIGTLWILFFENSEWRRIFWVSLLILLCPGVSYDYVLVIWLLPLFYFVASAQNVVYDRALTLLAGFLLVPLDYIRIVNDVSSSVILYPLVMIWIAVLLVLERRSSLQAQSPNVVVSNSKVQA